MRLPTPSFSNLARALAWLCFGLASTAALAQPEHNFRGIPYHRIYTTQELDSAANAVFITVAPNGSVFYGNRSWIFQFDGISWRKIYNNLQEPITALHWDEDGTIYAAGFNTFGIFEGDQEQATRYRQLVPKAELSFGENIEHIYATPEGIYLTGERTFTYYDKKTGEVGTHRFDAWVTANFWFSGKYHILTDKNEVFRYDDGQLTSPDYLNAELRAARITIADATVDHEGNIILASERRGLFRFNGQTLTPAFPEYIPNPDHLMRDIELLPDGTLLIASLGNGVSLVDPNGKSIEELDARVDFRFKTVRNLAIDRFGTVWCALSDSIAKVLLQTQLTAIDARLRPGLYFASSHRMGEDLYLRNFHQLYKAELDSRGRLKGFANAIPDLDIEVWAVAEEPESLYLSTGQHGIYKLTKEGLKHMTDAEGFLRLNVSKKHPGLIIGANDQTIALYRETENGLQLIDKQDNPIGLPHRMIEDSNGEFWLPCGFASVARISIQDAQIHQRHYTHEDGLSKNRWSMLWNHEGKVYIIDGDTVCEIDEATQKVVPSNLLAKLGLDPKLPISRTFTDPTGNIWTFIDNHHVIFWKQEDGSYQQDNLSLGGIGQENYFEYIDFYNEGEALIMTSFDFFHFRRDERDFHIFDSIPAPELQGIENSRTGTFHFSNLGLGHTPSRSKFAYVENSLRFHVSNTFTRSQDIPRFQFLLEGFSNEDPDSLAWQPNSSISFTNLSPGPYTFKTRAIIGNEYITPWVSYSFTVAPPFYRTPLAYILYALALLTLIVVFSKIYAASLTRKNIQLETMVAMRTQEIAHKNEELEKQAANLETANSELERQSEEIASNASQLSNTLAQLRETQDQLVSTARIAGRAEVATNVLHSVGNILNSIKTGLSLLDKRTKNSRIHNLRRISDLLNENKSDLPTFFAEEEKGKLMPTYLEKVSSHLVEDLLENEKEIRLIDANIEHIRQIIATQQSYARNVSVLQTFHLAEVVESALSITLGGSYRRFYEVATDIDAELTVNFDKHILLDTLINLVKNAKEAMEDNPDNRRSLRISCRSSDSGSIEIMIADNGSGISEEAKKKIFTHGFTTKSKGHGFGLHSCANAIKNLGGSLTLESNPDGRGAIATITLASVFEQE